MNKNTNKKNERK